MIVSLALASSIPVREWLREDDQTIVTALQILDEWAGGDD